jgi:NAD(P)H-flavin reductase
MFSGSIFITFIFLCFFFHRMELKKYTTTITKFQQLNDAVKLFRLSFPKGAHFSFTAGQFVILTVTDEEGKPQRRSYSIASSPKHTDYIELCVKILPDGHVSGVLDTFSEGSSVELDGPYGKFTIDKEQKKEIILIAAGVGIAPIRSLLFDLYESGYDAPVILFYGFRFQLDFLFKEELLAVQTKYSLSTLVPVISKPDGEKGLEVGRVTDVLLKYITSPENKAAYICGSLPMVQDVIAVLEKIGMTKDHIKTDAWG